MSRINFMNIKIDNLTMDETIEEIDKLINKRNNSYVVTPNIDHIIKLQNDIEFKEVYNNADLVLTDGMPLIWISRLLKKPIKEKISGSDLFPKLCELANDKKYNIYLLGAGPGVAEKAINNLHKRFPDINFVGCYSPKYGFENDIIEIDKIVNDINYKKPHILIVGLGAPKQEKFIYKYKEKLNVPISLGLGASIDFEAGNIKRAPKWMQEAGLEWLYRFLQEPKRLFKRYFIDDIKIIGLIIKYKNVK